MPCQYWTLQAHLFNDGQGRLYMSSRIIIDSQPSLPRALGMTFYNADTKEWEVIGASADDAGHTALVVAYDDTQTANLYHKENFDQFDVLHLTVQISGNADSPNTESALIYARSKDSGKTWERSDGGPIAR
eukprot:GHVO01002836.1.p1 GENE.GHVO01002836.1~~GHVO01002836.1.p1  ORF type:complete len:131 (+),score=12.97 GHVO01002836.1:629-1021(+)